MVRRFSNALGSTPQAFEDAGVFDGFIEVDTKLYVDPHLLSFSTTPEIQEAAIYFRKYFGDLIHIIKPAKTSDTVFWRQAVRKLTFREIPQLSLGYSVGNTRGSAIGPKLAASITKTAFEIINAGIEDVEIFELIGLFEEWIGADRISDMTAAVIIEYLFQYSQRIATELGLSSKIYTFRETAYNLPFDRKELRHVILVPMDILRKLPVAHSWSDIDIVCSHNAVLRRKVNQIIGNTWRDATRKISKWELRNTLLENPEVFRDLVEQYKAKAGDAYDFESDPDGEIIWYNVAQEYTGRYPLDLSNFGKVSADNINTVVQVICNRFKQLVEHNGLYQLFYDDSGKRKHERAAQLLFFGVADAYCEANDFDLNREPNAGRGPVDFKISRGYRARVNVEIKYSSNRHLEDGYMTQLPTYNQAEKTLHSILLVIRTGPHKEKLDRLYELREEALAEGQRAPEIILVDGRRIKSASKLRRKR